MATYKNKNASLPRQNTSAQTPGPHHDNPKQHARECVWPE